MTDHEKELEARAVALRRVVYGTPEGYRSDATAELASVERELAERRSTRLDASPQAGSDASGRHDALEWSEEPRDPSEPGASGEARPSGAAANVSDDAPVRATGRIATVAAFVIVLAVAAGLGSSAGIGISQAPRGLAVFDRPQRPSDESPAVALGSQADTVRRLGELFGRGFWAYRNGADRVCVAAVLIGTGFGTGAGTDTVERGECASTSGFQRNGIALQYSVAELGSHRPAGARDDDVVQVVWSPNAAELEWVLLAVAP